MQKLREAEILDHFFQLVDSDQMNKAARQNLYYAPVSQDTTPWLMDTEIVAMHPTAEGGLPHTRPPNIICIPQYFPESKIQETLYHELVHIDQRRRVSEWNDKFKREGWQQIDEASLPSRLVSRCRMNPDTIDQRFWAWKGRHVPLPLYEREDKPDLRQVAVHWYDIETGIRQPKPPRLFVERYGSFPSQPEHPRELSAVELAPFLQIPQDLDSYLAE